MVCRKRTHGDVKISVRTNLKIWLTMSLLLVGMVCKAAGQTIYVDADATGANNGSSWVHAYKYLQDALNKPPGSGDQIWVAEGIYKPDQGAAATPGDREATFQLINGVAMYGGFAGGETSQDQRDTGTGKRLKFLATDDRLVVLDYDNFRSNLQIWIY